MPIDVCSIIHGYMYSWVGQTNCSDYRTHSAYLITAAKMECKFYRKEKNALQCNLLFV